MKTIIGIVGKISSGKDTLGEYISKKLRKPIFEFSDPVKYEAKRRHIDITRENLMKIGRELAKKEGLGFPSKLFLTKIKNIGIITGIREIGNIKYIKKKAKLILISINAKPEIRFKRAKIRKKFNEGSTLKEFKKWESLEKIKSGLNVYKCIRLADYHIDNNKTIRELKQKAYNILKKEGLI